MTAQETKFHHVCLGLLMGFAISLSLMLFPSFATSEGIVGIGWNANQESDLAGYNLYVGTAPGVYGPTYEIGNITEHYVTTLQKGITYYFALTAYNLNGIESEPSSEISTTITFDSYFLTMDVQGRGEITSEPPGITCTEGEDCRNPFPSGTTLTLLATPGHKKWQFVGWGGDCSGTESCTVQLMADQIVTATFTTGTKGDSGGQGGGKGGGKK